MFCLLVLDSVLVNLFVCSFVCLLVCLFGCLFFVCLMYLIVCVCLPVLCHRLLECLFAVFAICACAVALACNARRMCVCLLIYLLDCLILCLSAGLCV